MTSRWPEHTIRTVLAHHSNTDAAVKLGISRERARQLRATLGVPTPPDKTTRRDRRVAALLTRGVPAREVAATVGVHPSTIRRIAHRLGVAPPPPAPAHGTRAGYLRHRRAGETACGPCLAANRAVTRAAAKKREGT